VAHVVDYRQGENLMRCFIPATDDELYAFIERNGVQALVPYRVGLGIARREELQLQPARAEPVALPPQQEPRLAA
jgi:hypothetical protein